MARKIFFSDVHMGAESSFQGAHPYGWLRESSADRTARFLTAILGDDQVEEIIIVGDLFDEWVVPVDLAAAPDPADYPSQFHLIAAADHNKTLMAALRTAATSRLLSYVPGNHDMLITKEILTDLIPGIHYLGDQPGMGAYRAENLVAEHGSQYGMFNAPDPFSNPGHQLPLGFFLSRMAATLVARTGRDIRYSELIAKYVQQLLGGDEQEFETHMLELVSHECGLNSNTPYVMNGLDGYNDLTLNQFKNWYGQLYETWQHHHPHDVSRTFAVLVDADILDPVAITHYFMNPDGPKIVIFGHSHTPKLLGIPAHLPHFSSALKIEEYSALLNQIDDVWPQPRLCRFIYVNAGAWASNKKVDCSYVETEIDEHEGKHQVRLRTISADGEISTIKQRYIAI